MSDKYDVAIIGASLDGLVAAISLSNLGHSVVVVESSAQFGTTHRTIEFAPGFRAPAAFDSADELHPSLISDLDLGAHGLKLISGGGPTLLDKGGAALQLKEGSISHSREMISESDREELAELRSFMLELREALSPALTSSLADPSVDGFSGFADLLHLGWALRRLGPEKMPEALRFLPMSIRDIMSERFESQALRTLLAAEALRGTRMAPRSDGSAFSFLHRSPDGLAPAIKFIEGGPGKLAEALAGAAWKAGATIKENAGKLSIEVGRDSVAGINVGDGSHIHADRVLSSVDPRTTLLDLVGAQHFQPDFVEKVTRIRGRGAVSIVRLALDHLPSVPGSEADSAHLLSGRIGFGVCMDDLERAHDALKYGELPERPFLSATIPSISDPSMAPDGKHVMNIWAHFTPYSLKEGSWDERRLPFMEGVISQLDECLPGLESSVRHSEIRTPQDIEREFGVREGCLDHVELSLDQILYMRPIPGYFRYATPLSGLFMCGPGTHPGGQSGLSGRCAAEEVSRSLKSPSSICDPRIRAPTSQRS